MNTIEVLREYCKRREEEIVTRRLACVDYDDRAAVSVDELRCLLNEIDRLAAECDLYRAALNCTLCLGTGIEEDEEFGYTRGCRKCREAREKARSNG